MANQTNGGFRVWGTVTGGEGAMPTTFINELANNYATAIGIGDIVIGVSDGTLARAAASDDGKLLGVVTGCSYVAGGITIGRSLSNYIPANTTFTPTTVGSANASLVQWVPLTADVILEVDGNAAFATPTPAGVISLIGENVDLVTGTADSTTGVSAFAVDLSTHNTTTLNFRIVGVRNYTLQAGFSALDNDPTASRFKVLVVCNEGIWPSYTTTGN
jgi:hypothetical protein